MTPKNGIQLYTCRDKIQTLEDCDKTFGFLSSIGVDTIQISGIGPIPQEQVKELVEKYNFDVCVTHTSFDKMKDNVQKVIDEHKMINCDCIGVGRMPHEYEGSLKNLQRFIKDCEKVGAEMKKQGCHFAYHNHDFEFKKIDGKRTMMDILLEETDPELFWFIPDVAWMQIAKQNPCELLEKMKGRCKVVHFKDYKRKKLFRWQFCELGKGKVDFNALYKKVKELEIPYIVFEQDRDWVNDDPLQACEESFKYMNSLK